MAPVTLPAPARALSPRLAPAAACGGPRLSVRAAALAPQPTAPAAVETQTSNIVTAPSSRNLTEGQRRKLELQAQAAAALEADNSWWRDVPGSPQNVLTARTPAAMKRLITQAPSTQLVVVDYLKPSCAGCRRLFPKLLKIAAANPDVLFLKVNVESEELLELAQGMQVTSLPWFHFFKAGDLQASFSANLSTVGELRKQVAAHKAGAAAVTAVWAQSC